MTEQLDSPSFADCAKDEPASVLTVGRMQKLNGRAPPIPHFLLNFSASVLHFMS